MTEPTPMQVDVGLVRELAELLDETRLTEIEVEDAGRRIRVVRAPVAAASAPMQALPAVPAAEAPPAPEAPAAVAAGDAVRSPMVGTVYLAPEPGAAAYVREGDQVSEGQTLLLVEAMKVMNPITAPRAGRLAKLLVENEQPVEYDQPLALIQ